MKLPTASFFFARSYEALLYCGRLRIRIILIDLFKRSLPFSQFDLVLQGECSSYTLKIIQKYKKLPFVNRIILSTYENPLCKQVDDDVEIVFNEIITPRGTGNRNLQINTSRNGLNRAKSAFCAKMRTDQLIRTSSMMMMYDYWEKRQQDGRIFVLGMYRAFPYHPRDHVFWGRTEDVKKVFDIPFDPQPDQDQDYRYKTRAETYIGQFYYARFDSTIHEHIQNPLEFTVDTAPKLAEALEKDFRMRDNVFVPFPKIDMAWPKHGLRKYHYHIGEQLTEYWGECDQTTDSGCRRHIDRWKKILLQLWKR